VQALPDEVFTRLSSWFADQGDEIEYESLKTKLLTLYSPSAAERARRILALPGQPLGDRSAEQIFDEINTLCRMPDIDPVTKKHRELDLKKEIWLLALPDFVRRVLDTNLPWDQLIKRADELIEANRVFPPVSIQSATTSSIDSETPAILAAIRTTTNRPDYRRSRPPPLNNLDDAGICGYHRKFGSRARTCFHGCKWDPKNGHGGR